MLTSFWGERVAPLREFGGEWKETMLLFRLVGTEARKSKQGVEAGYHIRVQHCHDCLRKACLQLMDRLSI